MFGRHEQDIRIRAINNLPNLTGRKISLKKQNFDLHMLFAGGIHIQNPNELIGNWYVFMLTGILPSFRKWKHHKVFYRLPTQKQVRGHNVFILPIFPIFHIFKNVIWGRNRTSKGLDFNVINYDVDDNSPMFRKIRDQIRFIPELGIFLGQFCYVRKHDDDNEPTFIGYFSLAPTFIFKEGSKLAELCGQYAEDGIIVRHHLDK